MSALPTCQALPSASTVLSVAGQRSRTRPPPTGPCSGGRTATTLAGATPRSATSARTPTKPRAPLRSRKRHNRTDTVSTIKGQGPTTGGSVSDRVGLPDDGRSAGPHGRRRGKRSALPPHPVLPPRHGENTTVSSSSITSHAKQQPCTDGGRLLGADPGAAVLEGVSDDLRFAAPRDPGSVRGRSGPRRRHR
uniref:Uncharacterized protein ORF18 n=1 Tax=Terrabacter sp. (strain DBF63) TaxID=150395 RepID=Q83ZE6_TERSD|nr:unknown [Terrabacter sp. DBF63]BAE45098.1 hypothetical protein [Terrabacter sp. DBF63]